MGTLEERIFNAALIGDKELVDALMRKMEMIEELDDLERAIDLLYDSITARQAELDE